MDIPVKVRADWQCKLVIIGDTSVGKTCILRRYTDNKFDQSFIATIGIDFKLKMVKVGNHLIKVQIWDTAGQEKFRSITTAYYRGAKGIFIIYDVTNAKSFENIESWIKNVSRWANEDTECMVVGNKCDISEERQVTRKQGEKIARDHGMPFIETSAKSDINIGEAFRKMLEIVVSKNEDKIQNQISKSEAPDLEPEEKNEGKNEGTKCC